jgi:hypothetical protein
MFLRPQQYDVVVAPNLYGDILSDGASALVRCKHANMQRTTYTMQHAACNMARPSYDARRAVASRPHRAPPTLRPTEPRARKPAAATTAGGFRGTLSGSGRRWVGSGWCRRRTPATPLLWSSPCTGRRQVTGLSRAAAAVRGLQRAPLRPAMRPVQCSLAGHGQSRMFCVAWCMLCSDAACCAVMLHAACCKLHVARYRLRWCIVACVQILPGRIRRTQSQRSSPQALPAIPVLTVHRPIGAGGFAP